MKNLFLLLISCFWISACTLLPQHAENKPTDANTVVQIAFLADVHFHDVYGKLSDNEHVGIPTHTPEGKKTALIRSMKAQLGSTRLFNENYFVLKAALDDLVKRNITLVALPGDFSDDGQPLHVRGLVKLLNHYRHTYGMRFFSALGNHDPVRPFTIAAGKKDFLAANGSELAIYSWRDSKCEQGEKPGLVCSDDLKKWGYKEIVSSMADFGFYPGADDLYFETPFIKANENAFAYEHRFVKWCSQADPASCVHMPDTSYLVEPLDGPMAAVDRRKCVPSQRSKSLKRKWKGLFGFQQRRL